MSGIGQQPSGGKDFSPVQIVLVFIEQLLRLVTLPVECVLHTRFGERYLTPMTGFMAFVVLTCCCPCSFCFPVALPGVAKAPGPIPPPIQLPAQQKGAFDFSMPPAAMQPDTQIVPVPNLPMAMLVLGFVGTSLFHWGFIFHRTWNSQPHIHSRYTGRPHRFLLNMALPLKKWFNDSEREFVVKRFIEPVLVGLVGLFFLAVVVACGLAIPACLLRSLIFSTWAFGPYMIVVAIALFVRTNLEYYRLRNKILDMLDNGIEMQFIDAAIDRVEPEGSNGGYVLPGVFKVTSEDRKRLSAEMFPPNSVEDAVRELDQNLRNLLAGKDGFGDTSVANGAIAAGDGKSSLPAGDAPLTPEMQGGSLPPGAEGLDPAMFKLLFANTDSGVQNGPQIPTETRAPTRAVTSTPAGVAVYCPRCNQACPAPANGSPAVECTGCKQRFVPYVKVGCPQCKKTYGVPAGRSGEMTCKKCSSRFRFAKAGVERQA